MTLRSRFLGGVNSPLLPAPSSPPPGKESTPLDNQPLDSDFIVILAALLCALICVLGLVTVARCAWIRRISGRNAAVPQSSQAAANKGLKKKVLESLPKLTYAANDDKSGKLSDCAICLSEFAAGDEVRMLPPCDHGFHVACIDTWLESHSSCPSCRKILVMSRCQKCGGLPEAGSSSSSAPANRSGAESEPSCRRREDLINRRIHG
ncbi:RING-H2 finger protein ATL8-like isoform X1 [Olea europaea var. sylvestris]|uniref:RING-H2 finger protein ATL8-like isoform X1 n=1 Tax=Olea europaea var. sylvestris TaxID=158386 RepID=UPI000C1CF883|nr:RING-H2 finger protein ATL8-like isoform X1 [Olea europaea var. sylvestris]